jgi:hypothetical protein
MYEIDVHFYLTYYLALRVGQSCISREEALQIATEDQRTDTNPDTLPGAGMGLTGLDYKQIAQNKLFHALNADAAPGYGSPFLWSLVEKFKTPNTIGMYLHYLQDTFSHEGFGDDPIFGHSPVGLHGPLQSLIFGQKLGTHGVDKTATDNAKTLRMAKFTFAAMIMYAQLKNCNCQPNAWTSTMDYDIGRFSSVEVAHPDLADVEGGVGGPLSTPYLADPAAVLLKAKYLGF